MTHDTFVLVNDLTHKVTAFNTLDDAVLCMYSTLDDYLKLGVLTLALNTPMSLAVHRCSGSCGLQVQSYTMAFPWFIVDGYTPANKATNSQVEHMIARLKVAANVVDVVEPEVVNEPTPTRTVTPMVDQDKARLDKLNQLLDDKLYKYDVHKNIWYQLQADGVLDVNRAPTLFTHQFRVFLAMNAQGLLQQGLEDRTSLLHELSAYDRISKAVKLETVNDMDAHTMETIHSISSSLGEGVASMFMDSTVQPYV